jgi:hypothetical protein
MARSPETHNNEQRPGTQKPRDVKEQTTRGLGRAAIKGTSTKK